MTKGALIVSKAKGLALVIGLSSFLLAGPVIGAEETSSSELVLERMAEASRALTSLQAELVQVKSYPQLSLTDPPEKGRIFLARKGEKGTRLRLEILEPEHRIVAVKDHDYVLYQPKIKQAVVGKLDRNANSGRAGFLAFLVGDLSGAEEDFEVISLGDEEIDGKQRLHLRLTARPGSQSLYRQIDLWIDRELWLPVRQELIELNNSVNRIELEDIVINDDIDEEVFKLDLPSDVDRVRG